MYMCINIYTTFRLARPAPRPGTGAEELRFSGGARRQEEHDESSRS